MLVSIIIPIYNVELYIGDCLLSVLRQTYNNIEVILVDDCSPDNSLDVAKQVINELASRYLCQIIKHDSNKGLSAARNSGVSVAKGDWVYFLDSDDEIDCNCIEILVNLVSKYSNVDFVLGGYKVVGSTISFPILSHEFLYNNNLIASDFYQHKWPVMACNKLINKDFFINNNLWFVDGLLHEDELFSFRLAMLAKAVAVTAAQTYIYKIRQVGSITSNKTYINFSSYLYINKQKLELVDIYSREFRFYYLSIVYSFIINVHRSQELSSIEKKQLIIDQIESFKKVSIPIYEYSLNWKSLLKRLYLIYFRLMYTNK